MAILILVRGVPGAGKSTLAKWLADEYGFLHHEADHFMVNESGEYEFRVDKLATAHDFCRMATIRDIADGHDVVVANTFIKKWEIAPYLDIQNTLDVDTVVVNVDGGFKSTHNVPEWKIQKMRDNFEKI